MEKLLKDDIDQVIKIKREIFRNPGWPYFFKIAFIFNKWITNRNSRFKDNKHDRTQLIFVLFQEVVFLSWYLVKHNYHKQQLGCARVQLFPPR